jgi:type II secretory pathway predicted ATPase ExeA
MMSLLEILAQYGYRRDPFAGVFLETVDAARIGRIVEMAVASAKMTVIVADRGAGKTVALRRALDAIDCKKIEAGVSNKEKMTIDHIEQDMIAGLTDETPRRSASTRKRQLRRVLGEAAKKKKIVLVIEEAHRIHSSTLRSLKTLMEMDWAGTDRLFTVILVAQHNPMTKGNVAEVKLRSDAVEMLGLTAKEAAAYIGLTVGEHFEADAITALARLPVARNFLELQEAAVSLMGRALALGSKKAGVLEVFDLYGGGLPEALRAARMTEAEMSKETGIARPVIAAIAGAAHQADDKERQTRAAIGMVLRQRLGLAGADDAGAAKGA